MAETIITVVLEVVKCLAPPTERQTSYLRSYSNNFMYLKNEIVKMKNDRASVKHKFDEALRQGEHIEKNVDEWLASANKVIADAEEFVGNEATANKHCLKGLCPNLKTRLQLSKEAMRLQEAISELREAGRFDRISYRSIPEDIGLKPSKDYEAFESRKSTLKNILSILKDPDVNVLGIYGMGGIGKTTLAKEVARQAENDKLFDQVVFAEVSQSPDIKKIQGEIADKLGLKFHEETESGRGRSLCNRLTAEKRLCEWNDALDQLRRPSSANFKNIQSKAYSTVELSYNNLESEELKKIFLLIGYTNMTNILDLLMYAMGLGLLEGINLMEEAQARVRALVQKLKASCMLLDNEGEDEEWFSMHDVVRDVAISIASTKQNGLVVTNGEPVNRWKSLHGSVFIILLDVRTNFLPEVLECPKLEFFLIRAGQISLSSTIPDNFFAMTRKVRVLNLTHMYLLSLPSSFCLLANLRTLCFHGCLLQDISIVGNLKKLEILYLQGSNIRQLPVELGQLALLRMLHLRNRVQLEVIPPNVLSKLSNLEELYIFYFNQWEMEVKEQKNASLDELKYLPNLTSLELHIKDVNILPRGLFFEKLVRYKICIGDKWSIFDRWTKNSKVLKLQLNTNIGLKDGLIMPLKGIEGLCLSGLQDQDIKNFTNELVKMDSLQLKYLKVTGCDALDPRESKVALPDLKTLFLCSLYVERIWQSQLAAMSCVSSFIQLQNLNIEKCSALEEIIVMDQAEKKNVVFPHLQFLSMTDLIKLTSFSRGDVLIEFSSLKDLKISKCPVFTAKYKNFDHDLIKKVSIFPNLESLTIDEMLMPGICQFLEDFICELTIHNVDLQIINSSLDLLQRFLSVKNLYIEGKIDDSVTVEKGMTEVNKSCDMKYILKPSAILNNLAILRIISLECDNLINLVSSSTTFQNLTNLDVCSCNGLIKLLTCSTAKSLVRLKVMRIFYCGTITEIVADDEGDDAAKDEIIFKELEVLYLFGLHSLTSFYSSNCAFKFPSLETLCVRDCPNMKSFSRGELSTPKLHKVHQALMDETHWIWEYDLNTTIQQQYLKTKRSLEEDLGQPSMQPLE